MTYDTGIVMELVPSDLATYLAGGKKLCEYRILFPLHDIQMTIGLKTAEPQAFYFTRQILDALMVSHCHPVVCTFE